MSGRARPGPSNLNVVQRHLILSLPNNFDAEEIDQLEALALDNLNNHKEIRGVVVDFANVLITDPSDLDRLNGFFRAVHLLGRQVCICGINPGVAAVVIRSSKDLLRERVGVDIDDILKILSDA